ncbi:complement regulator-acquiring protein [Borrelia hispanica]|uniref:complement regulator-acquiring protein n=1 Tax=Borrelia hispanica TaxID=40835 RepID=UPI001F29A43B|nr:complement regulator-acquiring protein [Borrelia hispanica]
MIIGCSFDGQLSRDASGEIYPYLRYAKGNKGSGALSSFGVDIILQKQGNKGSLAYSNLLQSINNIKKTLKFDCVEFDESQFDDMFQVCSSYSDKIKYDLKVKREIYASLNYDVNSLNNLKTIVKSLVKSGEKNGCDLVVTLLRYLSFSTQYVSEIVDEKGFIFNVANLNILKSRNNLDGLRDLKSKLDTVLLQHNALVNKLNAILQRSVGIYSDAADPQSKASAISIYLSNMISRDSDIYTRIFDPVDSTAATGDRLSLQSLKAVIMNKVNELIK